MFIGLACSFLLTFHIDTSWYRNNCASFGANSTISNLSSLTTADSNDLFPIVDTSAGQTKQITFSNATGSMATFLNATYGIKAGSSNIVTVGTITSGTWNGTALTVPYGGTGSTTLSSNQLFVGNGVSPVKSVEWGVAGQFLTSNGPGALPSFQSSAVNQASDYNWTGTNFFVKNLTASGTSANPLRFNGVSIVPPSTQGASSTYWCNDGAGVYTNCYPQSSILYRSTGSSTVSSSATTTVLTVPIPANTLGANGSLRVTAYVCFAGGGGSQYKYEIAFGNGSASTTIAQMGANIGNNGNNFQTTLMNYTTGIQRAFTRIEFANSIDAITTASDRVYRAQPNVDTTAKSYLSFRAGEGAASVETGYCGVLVELLKP